MSLPGMREFVADIQRFICRASEKRRARRDAAAFRPAVIVETSMLDETRCDDDEYWGSAEESAARRRAVRMPVAVGAGGRRGNII